MSTSKHTSQSIVATVASHEHELLAQIETSKVESGEIVEQARREARKHIQDSETAVNDTIAQERRDREAVREQAFEETVATVEARLVSVRESAAEKVDAMAQEVLSLFIPKSTGGN